MPNIKLNESKHHGDLIINHETGTIQFFQYGVLILSITHLPTPVPVNKEIEIVALPALTAYNEKDWYPDREGVQDWE